MPDDTLQLVYDSYSLPTAQHRAGLAGLIVHLRTLEDRRIIPLPSYSLHGDGAVSLTVTRASLQVVLDDLYDGFWDERLSRSKPSGSSPRNLHETTVQVKAGDGKTRDEKRF